jgi:type III restriction enzyme
MKIQFDANQQFQLDAISTITDLFDGQPQGTPEYAVINMGSGKGLFAGQQQTELGAGNQLLLAEDKLLSNARALQTLNDIEVADPAAPLEAWELFDGPANQSRPCPHFSVEMETGTGKTYVYLRSIFELSQRYGFQKFIIVVPSVAIREGVLKNIEITTEHFRALYNNLPFESFVICTLNETKSAVKKRQEIGRGLRLPVDQNGLRVFDESVNKLYVMANESYEDFAKALQTEYEEDCGVTFGKVPLTALAKLIHVVDGTEQPIGHEAAQVIRASLVSQNMLDAEGRIQPAFDPKHKEFTLELPTAQGELTPAVIDLLSSYQIERHIRRERDDGPNRLKKEVALTPEFLGLWNRIKPKTTYRVEFETDELIRRGVSAIKKMEKIEVPKIRVTAGQVGIVRGGIITTAQTSAEEHLPYGSRPVPDVLAYLQNETELTRSTLVRILKESGRLEEFFKNPQRFMDTVASILKYELHRLLVDGIKYEKIVSSGSEAEWEMLLFKNEEIVNYLTALKVNNSLYEYVVYDSEVERAFAKRLDEREDIKLFVKLPGWFKVDTPVGEYNPDWAIVKHDAQTLYFVKETKSTKDFLKLRTTEADKVRCGQRHFETLGVPFAVAVTAEEV